MDFKPTKLYYKIREVSKIIGVRSHVLRYWESEFPMLSPPKNSAGQRTYRPKDIEMLLRIRRLLYEEGYTIAGARKQLGARTINSPGALQEQSEARTGRVSRQAAKDINRVRRELENILTLLDRE